jgi:hypothetical protein
MHSRLDLCSIYGAFSVDDIVWSVRLWVVNASVGFSASNLGGILIFGSILDWYLGPKYAEQELISDVGVLEPMDPRGCLHRSPSSRRGWLRVDVGWVLNVHFLRVDFCKYWVDFLSFLGRFLKLLVNFG